MLNNLVIIKGTDLDKAGRNDTKYINEPHPGGGNPVLACRRRNYRSDIYGYAWDKLRQDRRE